MTDPIPFRPVDESIERRKLADEAHELLDNKAFLAAILALRKRYFAENQASRDSSVRDEMWARINALEDIPQELQILINNQKMHETRKR